MLGWLSRLGQNPTQNPNQDQDPTQIQSPPSSFGPTSISPINSGQDSMRDALRSIMRDNTPIGGRIGDLWKILSNVYNPGARQ
jgi:hypothetical protein